MKLFRFVSVLFLLVLSFGASAAEAYRMQHGDALFVSVWGEDTLQKDVVVLPDGSITFPLAGRVDVAGISTDEAAKRITSKLGKFLHDPQVTVVVQKPQGNTVYVIGKVNKSGAINLQGPTTVLQALSLASGFDKFADLSEIKVLRIVGSKQKAIPVNYNRLIKGKSLESNLLLKTGDTILVP